jgi:hypothetical protein
VESRSRGTGDVTAPDQIDDEGDRLADLGGVACTPDAAEYTAKQLREVLAS